MNKLFIAGLLGGSLLLLSGDKKKSSGAIKKPFLKIYISEDGNSICHMKTKADLNMSVAVAQNKADYDRYLSKNKDATIYDLARYRLDQCDKHGILPDVIDITATPAIKFLYVLNVLAAAIHMTLSGRMSQPMFASWIFDEEGFTDVLVKLGVMSYGDWYETIVAERAKFLNNQEAVEAIQQQLMLVPELKSIQSEVFATLMVIMFSTIIEASPEIDCTRINKFIIADYTNHSDKGLNPTISEVYTQFFNIFYGMKKGL